MTSATSRLYCAVFVALEWLDEVAFRGRFTPLCRLVGRMEPGYYNRATDWANPLFVHPEQAPDLFARHRASLCPHGYRQGCPFSCERSAVVRDEGGNA